MPFVIDLFQILVYNSIVLYYFIFARKLLMKKLTSLLLTLVIIVCLLTSCNNDSTDSDTAQTSDNLTSNTTATHSETIQPNPESDFEYKVRDEGGIEITKYLGTSEDVVIPENINGLSVSYIGGIFYPNESKTIGAFQNSNIKSVVTPSSLKHIYNNAFSDCKNLSLVTFLPNSEVTLISAAFQNCTSLEKIDLSVTKITKIGPLSFSGCTNLKEITFSDDLLEIGTEAFYNCASIEKIELPNTIEKIDTKAFANCLSLKSVNVPTKLKLMNIDGSRFYNVPNLEKIIFDDGWQNIQGYGFFSITSTVNIIIPQNVANIDLITFDNSGHINIIFSGNCPQLSGTDYVSGPVPIYYDPDTNGWDDCTWKNDFTLIPIE